MKHEHQKIRVYKEKDKILQVTHWDLDYLPKDEIRDLYDREKKHHAQKHGLGNQALKSSHKLSLLLITMGAFLLAGSLYIASLV